MSACPHEKRAYTPGSFMGPAQQLSSNEKEELLLLLQKYLTEERRSKIYENYQSSRQEIRETMPVFSSDVSRLKMMMEE